MESTTDFTTNTKTTTTIITTTTIPTITLPTTTAPKTTAITRGRSCAVELGVAGLEAVSRYRIQMVEMTYLRTINEV